MRKLIGAVVPVALVVGLIAAPADANRGKRMVIGQAFGDARFTVSVAQDERFRFIALDKGLAAADRGWIRYRNATAGFDYTARLVCVHVVGSVARFGYVIPNESDVPAAIRGLGVVFQVADNGRPGAGRDLVGYIAGPAAIAAACDTTVVPSPRPITAGDIVVRERRVDVRDRKKDKKEKQNRDHDRDDSDDTDDTDD